MNAEAHLFHPSRRAMTGAAVLAALGWTGVAIGAALNPQRAGFGYLAAYVYVVTCALGGLCLVMIAHTTGARWLVLVRRLAEAVCGALPVLALLFVPILVALPQLYPWASPGAALSEHARALLARKRAYLNVPFFVGRAALYLLVWSVLAWALRRWSMRQDRIGPAASQQWAAGASGAGLMLFAFTVTFAAFDWVMSLAPTWQSSIFGMYVFCGGMTAALGLLIVLTYVLDRGGALAGQVAAAHYHALGRLLLTFTALWAYIAYSQGMLIWITDIPEEVRFYTIRIAGGWGVLLLVLAVGHFLLPFLLLLSRPVKRDGRLLALIGAWMLVMHYIDVFWLVVPALHGAGTFHWLDLPALVAVGATAALAGAWSLAGHPLVPIGDPRLPAALGYQSP
jgi:hypothetical protein